MNEKKGSTILRNNRLERDKPKFVDAEKLSFEQLTDPDYAIKHLEKLNGGKFSVACSKCHHCR